MKWLTVVCGMCLCLLLISTIGRLRTATDIAVPAGASTATALAAANDERCAALAAARRSGDPAQIDRFLAEQRLAAKRSPPDPEAQRLCAEGLLERVLVADRLRGVAVGVPTRSRLTAEQEADLDEALGLLMQARSAGDDSGANHRLEAAVLANRITGLGTALQWNPRIEAALAAAAARDARDPALHLTLGLRQLLAPRFLGHDAAGALEHLQYAAEALPRDERPRVFAAMAAWLLHKRQQAIAWLEQAVAINADNAFARVVLARLRRGEDEPFARDVSSAEAAAK